MLRSVSIALATIALTSSAFAADKITNRQALEVLQGLRGLDGHQVIIKQATGDAVVVQPWEFGSATLRLKIANDISILTTVEKAVGDARNASIREILKDKPGITEIKPATPEMDDLLKQLDALLDAPAAGTQDLGRIKDAELKLDKNEIPSTVLAAIAAIREP